VRFFDISILNIKIAFIRPFNYWNAELNPICHLLALLGAHHNLHVSRIRVNMYRMFCSGDEAILIDAIKAVL